jgi:pimeloyl-ACP methyl ester carboxylesterase
MSMAASSHQSGEVAASVAAVTDVLDHLTVTTHQVHSAIARRGLVGMLPTPVRSAQDAVTAVYGTVRAGIALAGRTATLALESVERTRTAQPWTSTPRGRRLAGILNGAVGDRLADRLPPPASRMRVRVDGADLEPDPAVLARHYPAAATSVVVFVHGVIETDEWWSGPARARAGDRTAIGEDFGTRLTHDLGCSIVQVRYNSGRHISENGADLADLLDELVTAWPRPIRRPALVGHSMGGLVARSALHQAFEQGRAWPHQTRHLVCLGTPHTGDPWSAARTSSPGSSASSMSPRRSRRCSRRAAPASRTCARAASTSGTGTAPTRMRCTAAARRIPTSHPPASSTAISPPL